jgi:soluble lytic murein transglycosylase-like protein
MHSRALAWLAMPLLAASGAASADIYAYTDGDGVAHYSNVPTDPRYELFLRSDGAAEPAEAAPATWRERAPQFDALVEHAARKNQLEPALIRAVIAVESAFDPRAVSRRGAVGLMQLREGTARQFGAKDRFDPRQNIDAGARYLRELLSRYNDLRLALAAYNAGEAAVERFGRRVPPFRETQAYVPAVLGLYRQLSGARANATT